MSKNCNKKIVAFSAVLMLSIHSLLMGAAFGISTSVALTIVIFIAVLAHKGSASFALGLELSRSKFSASSALYLFLIFVAIFQKIKNKYKADDAENLDLLSSRPSA